MGRVLSGESGAPPVCGSFGGVLPPRPAVSLTGVGLGPSSWLIVGVGFGPPAIGVGVSVGTPGGVVGLGTLAVGVDSPGPGVLVGPGGTLVGVKVGVGSR